MNIDRERMIEYNIAYKKIKRICKGSDKNEENITIEYRTDAVVSDNIATIILPGMSDVDKWLELINKTMKAHTDSENEKRKREIAFRTDLIDEKIRI